ncbi:Histone-lysine N-methyltransferase H3 lysine-36 specific [Bienertia sinuspersici]
MASNTVIEVTSPLYLHPSESSNSVSVEKLEGSTNYRTWKRSMEIALASKRKLGFVTGLVKRDVIDPIKQDAWDTCNNMVISWINAKVSTAIKKSRKYFLNKAVYEMKQRGRSITEYYTELRAM